VSLAAEIMDSWAPVLDSVEVKMGSKGRFEVALDGEEIFSKAKVSRFPAPGEIVKILQPKLGPPPQWRPTHK
jgi:selT/selW/selH-like putative selenoprotein